MSEKGSQSIRNRRAQHRAHQQRRRRLYYGGAAVAAIIIIGLFALIRQLNAPTIEDVVMPESVEPPANADGKAWGPPDAPVRIVEYGDFQWPFCGQFATGAGRQLEEVYAETGLVRFEYKHFAFIGFESTRAAEAAECANEQDQFWPYHNIIFANQGGENQGAFNNLVLKNFATVLGLDEASFNSCLDDKKYRQAVEDETATGRSLGVKTTPTLYFNGEQIVGALPFEQLQSRIEAVLNQQE